ncbi:MAG: phosphoribosylglycinamide formyltransferase [Kangiellaceae bacterium]|jgi:phosphoribosylglycinamide formyltransferase-1|nr:phosphoribosylglycinamide formyltransferase [Kangiellaceae bacterium]
MSKKVCKVLVLISGTGSNLQAILNQQQTGELAIEIVGVISNRPNVGGLTIAVKANIPTLVVDHTKFQSRQDYDDKLAVEIDKFDADLIVLAGYMRIMSSSLVQKFLGKMINIHPSLLPKYPGLNTHQKALDNGDKYHGSSVHFVTEVLDGGPVIAQSKVSIEADDNKDSLAAKVKKVEHRLYPKVISWYASGRLEFRDNKTHLDGDLQTNAKLVE